MLDLCGLFPSLLTLSMIKYLLYCKHVSSCALFFASREVGARSPSWHGNTSVANTDTFSKFVNYGRQSPCWCFWLCERGGGRRTRMAEDEEQQEDEEKENEEDGGGRGREGGGKEGRGREGRGR